MAIAPPVINLVDTVKVDIIEASIDGTIGAVDFFPVNVEYTPANEAYWRVVASSFLNA